MADLFEGIKSNNFAVFGRVGMDLSPSPPGTKTRDATNLQAGIGGSSANIAIGLSKFGAKSALITSVSKDAIGDFCIKGLKDYGVDTSHIRVLDGEFRTSLAVYESVLVGHETVLYRNGAVDFQVTREDVDQVDLSRFGAFVTAGTVFAAEPSRSAAFHAFEAAKAQGLPVIFDVDYRPYSWPSPEVAADVLSRAGAMSDMIVGNDEEFGFMAGDMAKGLDKARELARTTAKVVVYKMGPEGAITISGDEEVRTGIYRVEALKPTGAGDSFMAGLLSGIAVGQSLQEAVLRGSACAAIVVGKPGCAPAMPYDADLEAFLTSHPGPT
ncbi:MAG: 5-dehydro-2-deoxygluconokinase [Boseongicola sp.]|nr:MAG: 5-dehydro-2-deoxygluconokinase [Boseongicola sp.]